MIIKMALAEEFGNGSVAWRFIGDIDSAVCYPYNPSEWKVAQDDYDEFYHDGHREVGFPTTALIVAKKVSGKTVAIVSNVRVYLLNERGETVERLN